MRPIASDVSLALWRLLPANPIVLRVVHMGGKRVQHLWVRIAYLLVLLFVMLIMTQQYQTGGTLVAQAKASSQVFVGISLLQLAMIALLSPVFTAGAISQEKDAETFNVLLTTPLTNAQIVLGSLMSRLFFVLTLLLSGLPIFCITMLYGGVTSSQIFLSFGIAACTAFLTGSLAILISVIKIGTRTTIFSFYVGIAVFLFAGLGIGMLTVTHVPESIPPGGTEGMTWLAPFHPFWALWVALNKVRPPDYAMVSGYAWPIDLMLAWPHKAYMILTLLVSIGFVAWSTFYVRSGARQGEPVWWRRFLKRTWKTVRGAKLTRNPRNVWKNPIAWREAMTRGSAASSGWAWYGYLALGVLAGAILLYAYWTGLFATLKDARYWLSGLVLVEFVTVMLMAANTAATAISRERESATLELMLTTPMTSGDILWGKFRGLVSFTLPLLAVPAVTVLVAGVVDLIRGASPPIVYVEAALLLPLLLLVYSGFACVLGLQMSLKSKRSVQAVLSTVGILIGVGFGLGLCAASMFWNLGEFAAFIGPFTFVTALFSVLNPTDVADLQSATGTAVTTVRMTSLLGTVISAGIYLAIVFGIYKAMVRNFDMILRKQMR